MLLLHAWPVTVRPMPGFGAGYLGWLMVAALGQLAATAFLLAAMKPRSFVVGVACGKTDALQVALFGTLVLGELPGWATLLAIALASAGVVLLSLPRKASALGGARTWTSGAAGSGLACGAGFALSVVGYRGAALQLPDVAPGLIGAWGVLFAQAAQSLLLGRWLAWCAPQALRARVTAWRISLVAGGAGALRRCAGSPPSP